MESVWIKDIKRKEFEAFEGNKSTDVLIVGGGITGILCSYMLKNTGVDCMLIEADRICRGITQNTTAKITLAHGLFCDKMIKRCGSEATRLYIKAQLKAMRNYDRLCKEIACDYEIKDSYVYSLEECGRIEKEIKALNSLGIKAEFSTAQKLPFSVAGAVRISGQAQFHPLKFLYEISKDLPIYESTKAVEFFPKRVVTNKGEIRYKKLIIATHFPILNKHGAYFLKLYQHRSYVLALKNVQNVDGMYVDESDKGLSFRNCGELLLLGGGGHRTGKKGGCWQELEEFTAEHYREAVISEKWATQDCMSLDCVPYIGQYSKSTPNVYVATGFNKWGMTNAMVAADILCDLVREKESIYAEVFSPQRSILHPQLAVNALESTLGLLTPTLPRCPHLGCALKYNRAEHSWDCPCHGSRFTENGELINNPATDDKKL